MQEQISIATALSYYLNGYNQGLRWGSTIPNAATLDEQLFALNHKLVLMECQSPVSLIALSTGVRDRLSDEIKAAQW